MVAAAPSSPSTLHQYGQVMHSVSLIKDCLLVAAGNRAGVMRVNYTVTLHVMILFLFSGKNIDLVEPLRLGEDITMDSIIHNMNFSV